MASLASLKNRALVLLLAGGIGWLAYRFGFESPKDYCRSTCGDLGVRSVRASRSRDWFLPRVSCLCGVP